MDSFKKYMDKVKAEEELKEKAKDYVRAALASESQNRKDNIYLRGGRSMRKKVLITVASIAICLGVSGGGYAYYTTPVNYVSLDINPSVELGINAFDTVVTVEPANEDGQALVEGLPEDQDLTGIPVEEAVADLVEEAVDQDYIADDGSTVIAVTAESDDEEDALDLQEKSAAGVSLAMSNKKVIAAVYKDCSDLALRTEAKALGISPGKYKLIKMLQTLDPEITVDQYKDAKVSQIIGDANQILGGLTEDELTDIGINVEKIKGTEKALQKAEDKAERELEREQEEEVTSDTDTTDDEDSEVNGNSNKNKNKNQNQDNLDVEDEDETEVEEDEDVDVDVDEIAEPDEDTDEQEVEEADDEVVQDDEVTTDNSSGNKSDKSNSGKSNGKSGK